MADHLRWGVLGASNFALKEMCPAIHLAAKGRLAAIASRSPEKTAPLAAMVPGLIVHDSYDALLVDPEIDAVYIPLPNHLHVEWSEKALHAGKHVLCEKPIALKAQEIDRLIALREETGKLCAEGFMVVHHPQWQTVKSLLSEGRIGRLRHIEGRFSFYNDDMGNIRNRADAGGGASYDIGVYPTVTSRFVMGAEPEVIRARFDWQDGIDTALFADLLYPNDVTMHFYCSMRLAPSQSMLFHGDKGWIRLAAPFNANRYRETLIEIGYPGGREEVIRFLGAQQYVLQVEAFNEAALNGTSYPCPLEFSAGNQVVIDALHDAAKRG
ncbi:Gfo/Idh/MocA family protein [Parvularcula marina]|uniref:Gfo/Idh/MocA family oxidoreductase n=1 Tax=Parvularcula marina TaxID=2292771 RepID=A0A371RHY4_9PROT|nr:Gfo/Idh/MocA family oxidoreductase [Parvularcula marina]RFB05053.1 gfo/Idh/MocA family oxidoreductase [Parvularcula marina]